MDTSFEGVAELSAQHPTVCPDVIRALLREAHGTVQRMTGQLDRGLAVDLVHLRLDVRTRKFA